MVVVGDSDSELESRCAVVGRKGLDEREVAVVLVGLGEGENVETAAAVSESEVAESRCVMLAGVMMSGSEDLSAWLERSMCMKTLSESEESMRTL